MVGPDDPADGAALLLLVLDQLLDDVDHEQLLRL
jgi:hypothetical protein